MARPAAVDMSAAAIEARLRELAELSGRAPRRIAVDMSGAAIEARLRELSALRELCLRLAAAGEAQGDSA